MRKQKRPASALHQIQRIVWVTDSKNDPMVKTFEQMGFEFDVQEEGVVHVTKRLE